MASSYLSSTYKLFQYYKALGDKTIMRLSFEELQHTSDAYANSVGIIIKHIAGNMRSRWTNFLQEDGEKEWRNRDQEFVDAYTSKEDIINDWESGWKCLFDAITPLDETHLETEIFIRNQGHTVTEAINRQLAHYAYHIGQMIVLAKQLKGAQWESLSIPKGKSVTYNQSKFSKEKGHRHFTDDL